MWQIFIIFRVYILFAIIVSAMDQIDNSQENVKLLGSEQMSFTAAPYGTELYKHGERNEDISISLSDFPSVFYKNDTSSYTFECVLSIIMNQPYVFFNITLENGLFIVKKKKGSLSSSLTYPFNINLEVDMASAQCALALLVPDNITKWSVRKAINVKYAYAPSVDPQAGTHEEYNATEGQRVALKCPMSADPPPSFIWYSDKLSSEGAKGQYLNFTMPKMNDSGSYICWGNNSYGTARYEFRVTVKSKGRDYTGYQIIILIAIVALPIIIVVAAVWGWNHFIPKRNPAYGPIQQPDDVQSERGEEPPTETFVKKFLDGKPESTSDRYEEQDGHERAENMMYDKYIEPTHLQIDWKREKGRGHYGKVYEGKYGDQAVAVKVLPALSWTGLYSALMEIKVMAYVGDHAYIVQFMGVDISQFIKGELYMVMELSMDGSLESYLRSSKPLIPNKRGYKTAGRTLSVQILLKFCAQIATAMEYLSTKRIIHGDLAARNVLVFPGPVVKLSDFGYARPLYEDTQYKARQNVKLPLPIEWASIEVLLHKTFSSASDVWAFGVTVWEIFTFGRSPFAECKKDEELVTKLMAGTRLPKPQLATNDVWDLMKSCWNADAAGRPSLSELKVQFQSLSGE